jgi:hypothetical protein
MSAGVGRLIVDRSVYQTDERFEKPFQLVDELAVRERYGRLGCQ